MRGFFEADFAVILTLLLPCMPLWLGTHSRVTNKAQGQTLDHVGIYQPDPVFSHGQLYVAMSRARSLKM